MRKRYLALLALAFCITSSCSIHEQVASPNPIIHTSIENREVLKMNFGKALAKSLAESPLLRALIKTEALKMFNNDFDVLYHLIKDSKLEEGITMRELLLKTLNNQELTIIENEIPLLTIFVPELPENTFSASLWDAQSQVPSVGVASTFTNDVKIIDSDFNEFTLKANEIPAFPVIVVKENERVIVKGRGESSVAGRSFKSRGTDEREFLFLSDCFDRELTSANSSRVAYGSEIDQKLKDAYQIYSNADGWHRDYIYYDITPTQPTGAFSYSFQEHLTSFTLSGNPTSAYNKIADSSSDPKKRSSTATTGSTPTQNSGWTGGYFEFKIRVLINSKNGLGEELITYFSAIPSELFHLKYTKDLNVFGVVFWNLSIDAFTTKIVNVPIINWDLNNYASTIKIDIEEVDLTVTTTASETRSVKFATNFAIDGVLKKIGQKFGASLEENQTQTTTKTYTEGNDLLGSVIVNFADNVIVSTGTAPSPFWITREYGSGSGWYKISVEPKRVQ